jgi:charged multivesicular body protein 3
MGQSQQSKIINAKMKAKEWQWELKSEVKNMDKEMKKIKQEELKLQKEVQAQAAQNNVTTVQTLTRQIVRSRKAVSRLEKTKANLHAVNLQITSSIATMSTTASIRVSGDVLAKMNKIAKTEGVSESMEAMRREMARCADAEDAVEDALRDSDEEEEAAIEMQKVLEEMALDVGQFGVLARPAADVAIPQAPEPVAAPAAAPKQLVAPVAVGAEVAPPQKAPAPPAQPAAPAPLPTPFQEPQTAATSAPVASAGYAPVEAPAAPVAPASLAAPAAPPAGGADNDELMQRLMNLKK